MAETSELTPDQKSDAARLMALYKQWKADEKARGGAGTQEAIAHALKMTQSAFSQYCRGVRPLNVELLTKIHTAIGWEPEAISPTLAQKMHRVAFAAGPIEHHDHAPIHMVDAKASAGKGEIVFSGDSRKMLMFRRDYLAKNDAKPEDVLAFEVSGDSMIDMHIIDGAVVLANRKRKEPVSKRVYVVWIDSELYVKQLVEVGGLWYARSLNINRASDYPDIQIDVEDRVVGRAFWCGFGL